MHSHNSSLAEDTTLVETLRLAVPLHMADLVSRRPAEREATARGWMAQGARHEGDALLYGGKRAAVAFESLAKGLAACAVLHGEARFPGLVFVPPPELCWATDEPAAGGDVR